MVIVPEVTDSSPASMRSDGRLPASGRADENRERPVGQFQIQVADDGVRPVRLVDASEADCCHEVMNHQPSQNFTAPPLMPCTSRRWMKKLAITTGTTAIEDRRAHRADLHTAEGVEPGDGDRQDRRFARREDESVEQVVPRQREAEDRRGADTGEHLGQYHQPERCEARETVDLCLFLQRARAPLRKSRSGTR